jgi:hypothetical protein
MWLTDLLESLLAGPLFSGGPRARRGLPAARFRPSFDPLEERSLLSAHPVLPVAAVIPEPGHLGLLRVFQQEQHLGPLYAALPDLGAGATTASPNTFVGGVPGTEIFAGVVVGPREALAYFCDGAGISGWLRGRVNGQTLTLSGKTGDRLVAQVQGDAVSGTLVLHGRPPLAFSAGRAADGASGLFRGVARVGRREDVLSLIRLGNDDRGACILIFIQHQPRPPHNVAATIADGQGVG